MVYCSDILNCNTLGKMQPKNVKLTEYSRSFEFELELDSVIVFSVIETTHSITNKKVFTVFSTADKAVNDTVKNWLQKGILNLPTIGSSNA